MTALLFALLGTTVVLAGCVEGQGHVECEASAAGSLHGGSADAGCDGTVDGGGNGAGAGSISVVAGNGEPRPGPDDA